ncbi:methylmalonyl-CoA mutase [Neobacillus notoginsengisoli]|uniref:Methylmalonyl-CoA mutase n=1 Tax=Neobacillus notoginsengisoli TaxID=1578198 RepID=A0A417YUZ3_9BACI|nr:methylmalonyl-CoA mutase family protein [Neobacillus notoginsengisoli]RHW41137.1 methylmalonyl-CoA mutase [Neobacillus notoginsengisoli]
MGIDEIMAYRFPAKTFEDWKEKAGQSLKGKSVETLKSTTYETIKLKPLYTLEDGKHACIPGSPDFRRGSNPLGYQGKAWRVAQEISWTTGAKLAEKLADSFEKGQTAISFELKNQPAADAARIASRFAPEWPFAIHAESLQSEFIHTLDATAEAVELTGYITSDPISSLAKTGNGEADLTEWGKTISAFAKKHPALRTVMVDTSVFHHGGASATQELAAAAASGVYYIEQLLEAGMQLNEIFRNIVFKFSIGANFFMEIAKLRAARIIWNRIGELYGVDESSRGMIIAAETSKFTVTQADPHVNLLRAGNEAFAAVLGGIHYLHVEPFNALGGATPFSERIARNVQLILREEALLDKVADPAGGSWFIENLTEQLAEKTWALFGKIDSLGGILSVLESGWLQKEINETMNQRVSDVKSGKQTIVGTNHYAKWSEKIEKVPDSYQVEGNEIPQTRLSVTFEELRLRTVALENAGKQTGVGLICLGSLKESKPPADFIEGFLVPGGIHSKRSGEIHSKSEAEKFVTETGLTRFCLCSSDEQYKEVGFEILQELKKRFPGFSFYLAGLPEKKEEWLAAGIEEFIYLKSNCFEFLDRLIGEMEARGHDAKA